MALTGKYKAHWEANRERMSRCVICHRLLKQTLRPTFEEMTYCGATCAVKGERRKQLAALAATTRAASLQRRYCQVCDIRISPDRLRRWHNARTCDDSCSLALRAAQKRGAVTRYRRRLRRRLAQDRADALVDVANCVVCRSAIAADRRARWPGVVTCSAGCCGTASWWWRPRTRVGGMYGYLYIPAIRTSLSKRMNATGLLMARSRSAPA